MCGIGIAITLGSDEHKFIANEINNRQLHRGPDFQLVKNYRNLSICHQRLSILDLNKRSNQPFSYKNIEIIFNGEIYNFQILREELQILGYRFNTSCDTEVIAIGIHHFGKCFLQKLDGMFSIAWFDKIKNQISITADPFGVKQIYYYIQNNIFFAASELLIVKDIAKLMSYKLSTDSSKLEYFNSYLSLPPSTTPFEEIKTISNGNLLEINLYENKQIIDPTLEKSFISKICIDEVEGEKIKIIDSVFKESFQADVKQAILLSGGIDSSNLALSAKDSLTDYMAYCIKTNQADQGYSDDLFYAQIVARKESIPLKIVGFEKTITIEKIEDTLARVNNIGDFSSALSLNNWFKKVSQDKIKVVHSGLGADEIYGGYTLMKNFRKLDFASKSISNLNNYFPFLNSFFIKKLLNKNPYLSANRIKLLNKLLEKDPINILNNLISWDTEIKKYENNNFLKITSYEDLINFYFNYFLSQTHLPITDSISMSYSIELRVPFLSRRLYTSEYPSLLKKCSNKVILKKRLKSKYGNDFINRSKSGLGVSPLDLENNTIEYLIENLYQDFLHDKYKITKDNLINLLNQRKLVRFPYMLFSLLTYKKIVS